MGGGDVSGKGRASVEYSRAQFEPGEVEALRNAFGKRSRVVIRRDPAGVDMKSLEEHKVRKDGLVDLLKEVPGYEGVAAKDCEYALEEAGFKKHADVDFDEFLEVCPSARFLLLRDADAFA